ncbi:unnamed protein product [Linum trigynum]|uniref:Uncharacterized protein n=1 Tax=Linum trigynum TaxID=586398 RepID=A0AAV2FD45_9ROSI
MISSVPNSCPTTDDLALFRTCWDSFSALLFGDEVADGGRRAPTDWSCGRLAEGVSPRHRRRHGRNAVPPTRFASKKTEKTLANKVSPIK